MKKSDWIAIDCSRGYSVITVTGDTYFGEWYTRRRKRRGIDDALQKYGYGYSFGKVAPLLGGLDYNIVNFEAVLTTRTHSPIKDHFTYILSGKPEESIQELRKRSIHAVSLANNHMMDYGPQGLRDTLDAFHKGGIHTIGAGENLEEAATPLLLETHGRQLILFSAYWFRKKREAISHHYATAHQSGTACLDESLLQRIRDLRRVHSDAYLIVIPHWGNDFDQPLTLQRQWAERLIMAGVDCILGHGSHISSKCEWINGKPVFYSLGNFVFNSNGNDFKRHGIPPYGTVAKLRISGSEVRIRLYPIFLYNPECFWRPYPVTQTQMREWADFCGYGGLDMLEDQVGRFVEILLG